MIAVFGLRCAFVLLAAGPAIGTAAPPALAAPPSPTRLALTNPALRFEIVIAGGAIAGRVIENRLTGTRLTLPAREFALEFLGGETLDASRCVAEPATTGPNAVEMLFASPSGPLRGLEVRVRYELPPDKPWLRKRISIRDTRGAGRRLIRVDLEDGRGVPGPWESTAADYDAFGSHPIFRDDLWAGVEFVAASNVHGPGGFLLGSRPGGPSIGRAWLDLNPTVIGAAPRGGVRAAFLDYIDDIRLAPARWACCYNSWWTLPERVDEPAILGLACELKSRLFEAQGVFFDFVATDAGWTDPRSIWRIDRRRLPQGFAPLRRIVESAGGRLGLWMSPSSVYDLALDYDWARRNGYVLATRPSAWGPLHGVSLADPEYRRQTEEQLGRLVRENGFAHLKFDGFLATEETPHHGLLPGADSAEPLAAYALELIAAAKRANPQLVAEPTFLNSYVNYISPWIIKYADSVFGNSGGDYPRAIGPAPDYRESCTNAREWYIFSSFGEVWLPQNALQYFDVIQCDEGAGFANHAAMAIGRGRFFLPAYINPVFMTGDDWAVFAGLLRWARKNQEVLRRTVELPARVEEGEPYAYAHWRGRRGVVAVRNPNNASQDYRLDLRAAGAPEDLADAVLYTQYPYRKGLISGANAHTVLTIPLAPWELLFVEIVPREEIREPVVVGGRWSREGPDRMRVMPDEGVTEIRVVQPDGSARRESVAPAPPLSPTGAVTTVALTPLEQSGRPGADGKPLPGARFELDCDATVPRGAGGRLLLLVQFPGREHAPSTCRALVDGREVRLEERSSAGHLGSAEGTHRFDPASRWAGVIPYASEWTWYICPVPAGASRIRFIGRAARPRIRIGAWLWAERDGASRELTLDIPCGAAEMPQVRERLERHGVCLLDPRAATVKGPASAPDRKTGRLVESRGPGLPGPH